MMHAERISESFDCCFKFEMVVNIEKEEKK